MAALTAGTEAPDFTRKNQHGEEISLHALRGEPLLVVFVPFAFTGVCTGEFCELRDNLSLFEDAGVRVIGVSCDAGPSQKAWADQENYTFDIISDFWPHGEISRAFGIFHEGVGAAVRGSFLIDAAGKIVWSVENELGEARNLDGYREALATLQ